MSRILIIEDDKEILKILSDFYPDTALKPLAKLTAAVFVKSSDTKTSIWYFWISCFHIKAAISS